MLSLRLKTRIKPCHVCLIVATNTVETLFLKTLDFSNLLIEQTKSHFPSLIQTLLRPQPSIDILYKRRLHGLEGTVATLYLQSKSS